MSRNSPKDFKEALKYAQGEAKNRSTDWTAYCQKFVRSAYGIPALYGSAIAQWYGLDNEDRVSGGDPDDAPVGSALFYAGGTYGHVMLAAHSFKNGTSAAWSNDLVRRGHINKVARTAPVTSWGQRYLGYGLSINGYDLRYHKPKPKQNKPYPALKNALNNVERALQTAKAQKDKADVEVLTAEAKRLRRLYNTLRKA